MSALTRRRFLELSAGALGAAALTGTYARWIEPHWLEIVRARLAIRGLPDALAGRTLLQFSDLHIGRRVSDRYLIDALDRARALDADIVAFTGDFISYHPRVFEQMRRVGAHLPRGRLASLGILGNHDYGRNWSHPEIAERVVATASDLGLRVLRNEACDVAGLQFIGLDDFWGPRFDPGRVIPSIDPLRAAIALSHNPDTADLPVWGEHRGWILAGHTHGGQCKPPFLPPPLLPVRNKRYTCGVFECPGGRRMYISRGVGHLTQVRFNVRPEITLFTMERS